MSIFKRDCPECAAPNAPDAIMCACGYCFDPDALADADPAAYARQQDRLYLDYLKARLAQAESDAAEARAAARAEAGNKQRVVAARAAQAALTALRTELDEWLHRVPGAASPAVSRRSAPAAPASHAAPGTAPAQPREKKQQPVRASSLQATARPGASFRRVQAKKAQAAVESRRSITAAAPRVAPAARAPASVSAAAPRGATQECPNCTASVSVDASRCRCGYAFPRPGDEVPALSLDAAALAILADDITLTGPNRRR